MTELEKLVNEKKGGSRGSASSNSYLSALVEQKKNEQKMATPYADAVKSGAGAQNLYAAVAKKMQGQSTMQTPYADAAAQMKGRNVAKGTSAIFNSVYGKADDRASSAGSGKYADILKASDYTELSQSGESKRKLFGDARYDYINNIGNFRAQSDVQQAQGRGQDYGKYAFMTDDEVGVYNYLYATQGKKAANAFLSDLEPELDKQWYTGTNRATTEALGKNAATRTLASAMTVAAQPTRTITSMIAMADDAVRTAKGQEINPYSKWRQASNITQELRADTSQHIEETNPGMGGKVGSFVYNTAMSAADSAMNALVAKGVGEAVGLTGDTLMKATNILGSALMSSEAASMSIAESKEKGYSNAGALALGLTRGAIEYASEAVGGEWVIRKIKANPLSFVKSMALTMIPEGMEEVMSDAANGVVNLAIDAAFGTEESGIPKMLEYYRTSGTDWQKKHAELATVLAVLGQEGLSFLGGALATLGSSSVQYGTNRANINQTAERLDTTPKNVVQMMQDAQTENPGVIYALAELTDAENADDLRQKIGTKEDMKRAAEYLTKQMGAGGRFGAQEGTYTAGAQNAPVGAQRAQNEGISTTPAAAINIQEGMNNGQSTYHREESGAAHVGSRGQAAEGAEGGLQALTGGRTEVQRGVGTDAQADLRQVTPAQLGIRNGGTEAVTVVDAKRLGGEAKSAYDAVLENGLEPVAVRGAIQVGDGYANAYTESGRVFFRVDAVDSRGNAISPEMLVQHEMFHNYASEEVIRATDEVIRESMTAEEYDAMRDAYKADYAGVYDFANMSVDEIERLLTEAQAELFRDLDCDAVDFVDNYDNTMKEPSLLPTTFPNVLVSANQGIAVGMASNICSFNLKEVCDTTIALMKNPDHDILETLPGPDFSTGGELLFDEAATREIYATGRGSFRLRSKWRYVKEGNLIEITEIPYSTATEVIMDKVAELIKAGKIREISDVRDENAGTDVDAMEAIARKTPLSRQHRPQWDLRVLGRFGIQASADETIWQRVWTKEERINNASTPMFLIEGRKAGLLES